MTLTILFYFLVGVFSVQIIYFLFFIAFCFKKEKNYSDNNTLVSVLVYTKNNAAQLRDSIHSILSQNYNNFEIVIINNASNDETDTILEKLAKEYNTIKVVNVENTEAFWGNKKYALTLGIKAATYDHILFTEVNSKPISNNWIQTISNQFSEKEIVIGYKKYATKPRSFKNILIRFEHLFKTILSFSLANNGNTFKAFENNFAYNRELFFKTKGYITHLKNITPHSDMFLKDASIKKNTAVTTNKQSFVTTEAPSTFSNWYNVLLNNFYTQKEYKTKHKFLISLFNTTRFLFYVLSIVLLVLNWKITLPFIISYYLILFLVFGKGSKKFEEKSLLILLPILDICLLLVQISIFITQRISKPTAWR